MAGASDFEPDFGGDQIDLRAAENVDSVDSRLLSQGTTVGTITTDSLVFTAPAPLEILAMEYQATLSIILAENSTGIAQAARRRRGKVASVTTRESHGFGRSGDYFLAEVLAAASASMVDDTNQNAMALDGLDGSFRTLFDPGLDSPTGPLTLNEGESVRVHLRQVEEAAPSSPGEQILNHVLRVYWEEVETAETEVRPRGRFPSGGEAI